MRLGAGLLLLLVSLGVAAGLRQELRRERRELHLEPRAAQAEPQADRTLTDSQLLRLSSSLGLGRALAIDFLSLRAVHLQEEGDFSEAAALARLITSLEPRLPQAWCFQAHNLAFNISPFFPPQERFPWVLRGLRLLVGDALRHNPQSGVIHHELAFALLVKIGHDSEAASPLYRSRWAAMFEPDAATAQVLAAWRLRPERLRQLEAECGVPLDLRAAPAHAFYWADAGLAAIGASGSREPAHLRLLLEDIAVSSLVELLGAGRPRRAGEGGVYLFLPDLRFVPAVERRIRREIEARGPRAGLAEEALGLFQAEKAWQLYLHGRVEDARQAFAGIPRTVGFAAASLEELLVERATKLEERDAVAALEATLDAAQLLARLGEAELADGHRALARLLLEAARAAGATAASEDEAVEASRLRLEAPWPADRQLPYRLEQILPHAGGGSR